MPSFSMVRTCLPGFVLQLSDSVCDLRSLRRVLQYNLMMSNPVSHLSLLVVLGTVTSICKYASGVVPVITRHNKVRHAPG